MSVFALKASVEDWISQWWFDLDEYPNPISDLVYVGPPGSSDYRPIDIRVAPRGLPRSKVVRINRSLQYASNLVNIAVPHTLLASYRNTLPFDVDTVLQIFQQHFDRDLYDDYALLLETQWAFGDWAAFHSNPGPPDLSDPRLSVYKQWAELSNWIWAHEIGHNWNFRYDLYRLAGWRGLNFDGGHGIRVVARPPGVLVGPKLPIEKRRGKWTTEWVTSPGFHPLELFGMGLLAEEDVPDVEVFRNQRQATNVPNLRIEGRTKRVSVEDVVQEYGHPEPLLQSEWRVATILVSERLLPKRALRHFNFFIARMEDAGQKLPRSFDSKTGGLLDLQTDIAPLRRGRLKPPRGVAFPDFPRGVVRGVKFDSPVPSRLKEGDVLGISGSLTERLSADEDNEIFVEAWSPEENTAGGWTKLESGHRFSISMTFERSGRYTVRIWVPSTGLRAAFGPIWVESGGS